MARTWARALQNGPWCLQLRVCISELIRIVGEGRDVGGWIDKSLKWPGAILEELKSYIGARNYYSPIFLAGSSPWKHSTSQAPPSSSPFPISPWLFFHGRMTHVYTPASDTPFPPAGIQSSGVGTEVIVLEFFPPDTVGVQSSHKISKRGLHSCNWALYIIFRQATLVICVCYRGSWHQRAMLAITVLHWITGDYKRYQSSYNFNLQSLSTEHPRLAEHTSDGIGRYVGTERTLRFAVRERDRDFRASAKIIYVWIFALLLSFLGVCKYLHAPSK